MTINLTWRRDPLDRSASMSHYEQVSFRIEPQGKGYCLYINGVGGGGFHKTVRAAKEQAVLIVEARNRPA